jgi:hypothetical protein
MESMGMISENYNTILTCKPEACEIDSKKQNNSLRVIISRLMPQNALGESIMRRNALSSCCFISQNIKCTSYYFMWIVFLQIYRIYEYIQSYWKDNNSILRKS